MGAEAGHPFVLGLLEAMVAMPPERQQIRFALGTHLLQAMLETSQEDDVSRCDAGVFYPVAPEISQHWFRKGSAADLGEMLLPETKIQPIPFRLQIFQMHSQILTMTRFKNLDLQIMTLTERLN